MIILLLKQILLFNLIKTLIPISLPTIMIRRIHLIQTARQRKKIKSDKV